MIPITVATVAVLAVLGSRELTVPPPTAWSQRRQPCYNINTEEHASLQIQSVAVAKLLPMSMHSHAHRRATADVRGSCGKFLRILPPCINPLFTLSLHRLLSHRLNNNGRFSRQLVVPATSGAALPRPQL